MPDPLNNEVAELLSRTDSLLRSSVGGDCIPSESGGRLERQSIRTSFVNRARASGSSRTTEFDSENPTPRLLDNPGRAPPSMSLMETALGSLGQSGPSSLDFSMPGGSKDGARAYNSFGGLQEMVSMVDAGVAPASPPVSAAMGAAAPSRRLSFAAGPFAGSGGKGSLAAITADLKPSRVRSASRLGSPTLSPRSPLHKVSSLVAPAAKVSRRAQLQSLLGKDLAQPQDVLRFKADVKNLTQPTANVVQLAGDLQEKFNRVNRKLKNWNLIETAATERFNAAMDVALEALFSRINLAWPSSDLPPGASDSSAGRPSTSAYDSMRSRAHSKGGRQEHVQRGPSEKDADYLPHRRNRGSYAPGSSGHTDDPDDAVCESPSSSASQRYAWDEELSTTTDADEDTSRGSTRRGGSKASRMRAAGQGGGTAPGQQRGDARREQPSGRGHDGADHLQASARTDAESRGRRYQHPQDAPPGPAGAGQQPANAPAAWHVGPNGTYLTGPAPAHPSAAQAAASGPSAAYGLGFTVPSASAMFGLPQPPYTSSSAAFSAPSAAGYQGPLAGPKGASGAVGAQHYSITAAARHGLMSMPGMGAKAPDVQPLNNAWKPGMDLVGGFPFASSGLWTQPYGGSAAPTNPTYGVQSVGGANDSNALLFMHEQGPGSSAVSYMAPTASTGRNGPGPCAASELYATASSAALHNAWQAPSAHSTAQVPQAAHGAQESSASGPAAMPAGFDMADPRSVMYSLPYKSAYGYGPGIAGPNPQMLAFAGMGDFMGAAAGSGVLHMPGGHAVTYGSTGPVGPGHERHAAGQYLRYAGN